MNLLLLFGLAVLGWAVIRSRPRGPAAQPPAAGLELGGDGDYDFEVVGESHYQDALEAICGGKCEAGHELEVEASLVLEDDNAFDDQAVAVEIEGRKVAYLSRADARIFRREVATRGLSGVALTTPALIVGGWRREKRSGAIEEGAFGVKLDL